RAFPPPGCGGMLTHAYCILLTGSGAMHPIVRRCHTVALLAAVAAGCGRQSAPLHADVAALDQVLVLMHSRLALMHDVARAKWNAKRPVTDPDREREL